MPPTCFSERGCGWGPTYRPPRWDTLGVRVCGLGDGWAGHGGSLGGASPEGEEGGPGQGEAAVTVQTWALGGPRLPFRGLGRGPGHPSCSHLALRSGLLDGPHLLTCDFRPAPRPGDPPPSCQPLCPLLPVRLGLLG